jgi:hypothetical protein
LLRGVAKGTNLSVRSNSTKKKFDVFKPEEFEAHLDTPDDE